MTETNVDGIVWPEDAGTGITNATSSDFVSAGYVGSLAASRDGDYVDSGIDLMYNSSGDTLDIGGGLAFIEYNGSSTVQLTSAQYDEAWDNRLVFMVSVPSVSNLQLDPDGENDIYLAIDNTSENSVRYRYGATVSEPSDPSLLLGTVDTGSQTVTKKGYRAESALTLERVGSNPTTWDDVSTIKINNELDNLNITQHPDGKHVIGTGDHSGETLNPQQVNTKLFSTEERGTQVVCHVDESFEKIASGPQGIISRGFDTSVVLQDAVDWVGNNGYGTVTIHDRQVIESAPLTVPNRVRLHCSESGVLVNGLTDRTVPFIEFEPGATVNWLRANADGGGGITFGATQTQANNFTNHIYLFNVGNGNVGIETAGYQITGSFWHVSGDGSNDCTAFKFQDTSDLALRHGIAVGTNRAAVFGNCEHIYISSLDCDSGSGYAIDIGEVHDMHLNATIWCNQGSNSTLAWDRAVHVNDTGHTHSAMLNFVVMRSGPEGIYLGRISDSTINAIITNQSAYPPAPDAMDVGLIYSNNVNYSTTVNSTIDATMQTAKIQGTINGTLNNNGYQDAGVGNSPNLDYWNTGQYVTNRDDGTVWLKNFPDSWTKITGGGSGVQSGETAWSHTGRVSPQTDIYLDVSDVPAGSDYGPSTVSLFDAKGPAIPSNTSLRVGQRDGGGSFTNGSVLVSGDGSTSYVEENVTASWTNNTGSTASGAVIFRNNRSTAVDVFTSGVF